MKKQLLFGAFTMLMSLFFVSCGPSNTVHKGDPYDPAKPIVIEKFKPEFGGMASKMIIEGSNFGTDKDKVKVYFNEKEAAVVQTIGNMIYVITPRQPGAGDILNGDSCRISIVVENSERTYSDDIFMYYTTTTVSTICGVPETEDSDVTGGDLSTARFASPKYLTCDNEGLVYLVDWMNDWGANKSHCFMVDQERNVVQILGEINRSNAPCLDPSGENILLPADDYTTYYEFSILNGYDQITRNPIRVNSTEWNMRYKHSLAPNVNGMIYSVTRHVDLMETNLVAINPQRNTMEIISKEINSDYSHGMVAFNPLDTTWLYICQSQLNMISRYNIVTGEYQSGWAGAKGSADHIDGPLKLARFNYPRQICFDYDGNLFVADTNNHCIRKISPQGIVTTVIGQRGKSGYIDGGPDDALFNSPEGVTVTPDNAVWIADTGNDVLRKLAIE